MISTLPKRRDNSIYVLNFGSWLLSTSTFSCFFFRFAFNHSVAYVAGSTIRGVSCELRIMMAFSPDNESAGSPSFFQVSIYASELKKLLKEKSCVLTICIHSDNVL